ncbi:hypothetical protein SEUCBS139899_009788 [Sporothrix eucalyptigena]|uniref:Major facilitator superfamily (MFS) profile domain-containing protein n=1 Tax=Sporothrix eucalyptigena TaxID=1812306 RepID=A0ABP0CXP6_9PEZI
MDEHLDENAIREIEEILGTKIYPGTEIMRDVGSHHFVKAGQPQHGQGNDDGNSNTDPVLVPQPNDDPADPLNWTPLWKACTILAATILSFCLNLGPLALAPMFGSYMEEWDRSLADVVQFTGVAILVLGFSNFIWVPIMVAYGRRPVAIISTMLCLGSSIWRARATSYNSFMGASVLNGVGAGPCETLMPQVIADIIFLHDRGKYQTLYFSMYFISLMVGPIISGAMDFHTGWRSFWWFNTGIIAFALLFQVFLFPETRYDRVADSSAADKTGASKNNNHSSNEVLGQPAATAGGNNSQYSGASGEKVSDVAAEISHVNTVQSVGVLAKTESGTAAPAADADANVVDPVDHFLGVSKPTTTNFALFQRNGNSRSLLRELWLPWFLHIFPIVEFASFVVSWSASCFLVVNLSQSQAFAAPPYNYSSQTIGLFNLAVFIGAGIGLFTCGPFSDMIAAYLTRRNNGVREPEMRLVAMIPYVLAMIIGSVVTAVGYDHHWPWQVIVVIGYGLLGVQVAALPSIVSTYAIDSYRPVTGSMFVAITVNKNVWGYGVSKFLTPWAEKSGFRAPILTNMGLTLFFCSLAIPFWFWGKKLRGVTRNSFVHQL